MRSLVAGADGPIEVLVTGSGDPVTVFAHGLAGSIDETRPFGSGVVGTKAFLHFRGHGATLGSESPWTYAAVADELQAVADKTGATRALGVSLGAGALLRLVAEYPDRFERLVFVLPAAVDRPRTDAAVQRMARLADLLDHRDLDAAAALVASEQPGELAGRPDVHLWSRRQARRLAATPVARALRELPALHPLEDRSALIEIRVPVLVVGQ